MVVFMYVLYNVIHELRYSAVQSDAMRCMHNVCCLALTIDVIFSANYRIVLILRDVPFSFFRGTNRVVLWATRHSSPDVNPREPIIRTLYPILDTATGAITLNRNNSKVVGIIAASFYWRSYLENILPNGENGLVVVFANACNQSFTYQINGHEAQWLGTGDLHDHQFDDMGKTLTFEEIGLITNSSVRTYGGLPIDLDYCAYTVSTYPSQFMKDTYHTNEPVFYTMIAVGIFVFTALVFIGYDKLVSMRQKKVMSTAVQSTTIVSSLFPSNVRDRLMEGNIDAKPVNKVTGSMFQPTKSRLRTFLNDGDSSNDMKPIADLFTDTTVLFADIAGFTAWSSVREPTQVFTLLENIYLAFDSIASRRGVFKVEVREGPADALLLIHFLSASACLWLTTFSNHL